MLEICLKRFKQTILCVEFYWIAMESFGLMSTSSAILFVLDIVKDSVVQVAGTHDANQDVGDL